MFKSLLSEWKKNKFSVILIMLGYIIGLSVLSLGISMIHENKKNYEYSVSGNPEHYGSLFVRGSNLPQYSQLVNILDFFSKKNEVQIGFSGAIIDGMEDQRTVVSTIYHETPEFVPPLLAGRYFTSDEVSSSSPLIVMGKELYEEVKSNMINDAIKINGVDFKVIGVIGRSDVASQWDSAIYLPLHALPQSLQSINQEVYSIYLRNNTQSPIDQLNDLRNKLYRLNPDLQINLNTQLESSIQNKSIWNNILLTSLLSGVILLVSCINVVNLSLYWVLDRKKEIGIRKALGATNRNIAILVIFEMIALAVVSSIATLVLLYGISCFFKELHYSITLLNWLLLLSISILCGMFTSLFPVRSAIKIQAIEIIKRG